VGEGVDWCQAEYRSIVGTIASHWRMADGEFELEVTIPANTQASVTLPLYESGSVTESGSLLVELEGLEIIGESATEMTIRVGSGEYKFISR